MAARPERFGQGRREAGFDRDLVAADDAPARRIGRRLRVLAIGEPAQHHLRMPLRLHRAAHDAEGGERGAVRLHGEAGDDGVERPLSGRDLVDMAGRQREAGAAVLQADAGAGHDDAGAEAHEIRLDERHHHAVRIRGGEVDRAARLRRAIGGEAGPAPVDQARPPGQVIRRQQRGRIERHVAGLGDMLVGIGQRQLGRFDGEMHRLDIVDRIGADAEISKNAEGDQGDDALAVRRDLVHGSAGELLRQRADPVGPVRAKIVERQNRAMPGGVGGDLLGNRAAIEALAFGLDDRFERRCQRRIAEALAGLGCAALRQEGVGEARLLAEQPAAHLPEAGDDRRDGETVAGIADGRRGQRRERQAAEAAPERDPAGDGARHGDAVPAARRHGAASGEARRRPGGGRPAGRVQPVQFLAVPEDGEGVAAEAAAGRLDHGQRHGGGKRRVDGVAALRQHGEAGLSRERLRGRDDVVAEHGGALRRVGLCEIDHRLFFSLPGSLAPAIRVPSKL